jgi:hypothetical protein
VVEVRQGEVKHWQAVRDAYRTHPAHLSLTVHPWRLVDSTRQTSQGVERQLHVELQAVQDAFERHPCTRRLTPEVLAGWQSWADEHARAFQRASSAVEGRNGYRAQMQHNHRGLPMRR